MARNRRWFVFVDDTGSPGPDGPRHFGYAAVAFESAELPMLTEMRARYRVAESIFFEQKAKPGHRRFAPVINDIARLVESGHLFTGCAMICKPNYRGPYMALRHDVPASAQFMRNYALRHTLEMTFDAIDYTDRDTAELILDRVDYSDEQVFNLRDYLRGRFAPGRGFAFPTITHVTHADSRYVEGLQVADHIARLAYAIAKDSSQEAACERGRRFLAMKTLMLGREADPVVVGR